MQDLNTLYINQPIRKTFQNFFKSTYYKDAYAFLEQEGVPKEEIIQRTKSYRGYAAETLVHDLVALAFQQWLDPIAFNRMLLRIIS